MRTALILFTIFISSLASAQVSDSLLNRSDVRHQNPLDATRSSSEKLNKRIDSLQLRMNNLFNPDFTKLSKRARIRKPEADSLKAIAELDSIKQKLSHKIDSLEKLRLPTEKYTAQLDSIKQIGPAKYLEMARHKASELEASVRKPVDELNQQAKAPVEKLDSKVDKIESKINDKLGQLRQEGGEGANIPGDLNTTLQQGGSIPLAELKTDLSLPDVQLKNPAITDKFDNPVQGQLDQLGQPAKEKVNELKSIPGEQIDRVKSMEGIKSAQDKVGDLNQGIDGVQAYGEDASKIVDGNIGEVKALPDAVESKARELDAVEELEKQTGEISKMKDMLGKGNDPEALKREAMKQAQTYAKDHFADKQEALHSAMERVSKLKSKFADVSSIKDLPKRAPNPMKERPTIERILPGVTLQFIKQQRFMLDINPNVAWRFSGRINAGLGWNERLSFSSWNKIEGQDRIFGPRVFGSYAFKRNVSFKLEVERMNAFIPVFTLNPDAGSRQWLWSAFVGLKKDYTFMKKIRGNIQVLYNLYDDHDSSPYFDRLNIRTAFEFPMKKKKRSR